MTPKRLEVDRSTGGAQTRQAGRANRTDQTSRSAEHLAPRERPDTDQQRRVRAAHFVARRRTRRSSGSLVTTVSWSRARRTRWASTPSAGAGVGGRGATAPAAPARRGRAAAPSQADTLRPSPAADDRIASPSSRSNDTLIFSTPMDPSYHRRSYHGSTRLDRLAHRRHRRQKASSAVSAGRG